MGEERGAASRDTVALGQPFIRGGGQEERGGELGGSWLKVCFGRCVRLSHSFRFLITGVFHFSVSILQRPPSITHTENSFALLLSPSSPSPAFIGPPAGTVNLPLTSSLTVVSTQKQDRDADNSK